jgi:type IV pilus assembly protein PilC
MAVAVDARMERYLFVAKDEQGKRVSGALSAISRPAAWTRLTDERHLAVVSLDLARARGGSYEMIAARLAHWSYGFLTLRSKLLFFRQIAKFMRHGIPIEEALELCSETARTPRFRDVLRAVKYDVMRGRPLSEALSHHEEFGRVEIAMVRSGEKGAGFPKVLERVAFLLSRQNRLTNKLLTALVYPAIIALTSALFVVFITTNFVPQFAKFAGQFGAGIPGGLSQLVDVGHFIASPLEITLALAFLVMVGVCLRWLIALPGLALRVDEVTLKIWLVGRIRRLAIRSMFARLYSSLYAAGVPVITALDMIIDATTSPIYRRVFAQVRETMIADGGKIGQHLQKSPWFDRDFVALVRAGEESASLVESLDTIAEEDDVEIDNLTEALSRTFEPIMILVMGGLVGYLVTTVYGSIYWLYGRIR